MDNTHTPLSVQLPKLRDGADYDSAIYILAIEDSSDSKLPPLDKFSVSTAATSNPRTSLATLDTDVLILIFKAFLTPANISYIRDISHKRTTLLLLNHTIKRRVTETPSLWRHISVSGPKTNHRSIKRSLEHARGAELWWVFDLRNDEDSEWATDEVVNALFQRYLNPTRMKQTSQLHIIINTISLFSTVFRCLRSPAPILREFKMIRGDMDYTEPLDVYYHSIRTRPPKVIDNDIFTGHAPMLRLVQVHHAPMPYIKALFKISVGSTASIEHLDLSQQGRMHPETFYGLLDNVSSTLKTLVLRNAGPAIENNTTPNTISSQRTPYHRGQTRHTSTITLPFLTNLIIGGMTANYLGCLLSTLHFLPLTSLGVHGVSAIECEKIWDVLSRQPALLPGSDQDELRGHDRAFSSIKTLELFDLKPSSDMKEAYPKGINIGNRGRKGPSGNAFQRFLADLGSLTEIKMRKVGLEFLKALGHVSLLSNESLDMPFFITVPVIECLDVSCIVDGDDEDLAVPEDIQVVGTTLLEVLRSRREVTRPVGRLHLDGDEWDMRRKRKQLIDGLHVLKERGHMPLIYWDARAAFFMDYYDSTEI